MTLNLEQIKEIIPHRDPFLLIDEVTELEPGVSVTAKKYLKPDEYLLRQRRDRGNHQSHCQAEALLFCDA